MKNYMNKYESWLLCENLPLPMREELVSIKDDLSAIREAFEGELNFGTSGLRGIMGVGTNRMNSLIVHRVSRAIAKYLLRDESLYHESKHPICIIAYDSRHNSRSFAFVAARALADRGIEVKLFDQLVPVSMLSFEIRRINADIGIMITASHNSKEYNGYKVYNSYGGQILPDEAVEIQEYIERESLFYKGNLSPLDSFMTEEIPFLMEDYQNSTNRKYIRYTHKNITWIYRESMDAFVDMCVQNSVGERNLDSLRVVYSPLNGAGLVPVREVFQKLGIKSMTAVKSQMLPDGNFPTCPRPNPERREVYGLGQEILKDEKGDLLIVTDPDCDRVGMAERDRIFTGNETAILLLDYLCKKKCSYEGTIPDCVMIRSIVSTPLADKIAADYGMKIERTLVGFKYIAKKMEKLNNKFFFGFEEGNGYAAIRNIRDKDGVSTAMLLAEMAAEYKAKGSSLERELSYIYRKYGAFKERVIEFTFQGIDGNMKRQDIMERLRRNGGACFPEEEIINIKDYLNEEDKEVGRANVMEFSFAEGRKMIVRPSGTEPKIKIYLFAEHKRVKKAEALLEDMSDLLEFIRE